MNTVALDVHLVVDSLVLGYQLADLVLTDLLSSRGFFDLLSQATVHVREVQ